MSLVLFSGEMLMPIRKIEGRYVVTFTLGGKKHQEEFDTHAAAAEWDLERRLLIAKGRRPSTDFNPATIRLEQAFDVLYHRVWKDQKSAHTHRCNANAVLAILGNVMLADITVATTDELVALLERKKYSAGTINRKIGALSKVLHFARKRGWIQAVPPMERRRERCGRAKFFTVEEERAIVAWFRDRGQETPADFIEFQVDTGLRHMETLRLKATDVADRTTAVSNTKSKSGDRNVPQTPRVQAIVERRLRSIPPGEDRLFWDLTQGKVTHAWGRCRRALGHDRDPDWVVHTLRHTFISRLVQRGVHIFIVQRLAGHACLSVTQRYAHLDERNLREAIATLIEPISEGRHVA